MFNFRFAYRIVESLITEFPTTKLKHDFSSSFASGPTFAIRLTASHPLTGHAYISVVGGWRCHLRPGANLNKSGGKGGISRS